MCLMARLSFFGSFIIGLTTTPGALAGFSPSSSSNLAVYWGQNSYGLSSGDLTQHRLSSYCANTDANIVPLAFLTTLSNPSLNLANAGDECSMIAGTNLFSCPDIGADIIACQSIYGKTIILSLGGATYTEAGFPTVATAEAAAENIWNIFGPATSASVPRPFGVAAIDGFDFDFESAVNNMPAFALKMRDLMTASTAITGRPYILTAAPQCPYPDVADDPMLAGVVSFDAIFVQFYNNYCGTQSYIAGSGNAAQDTFNFDVWDTWAKTVSLNPNVKILLGIPGNERAAGGGYVSSSTLSSIIAYCKTFSSFGGVMVWDMTQLVANAGYMAGIVNDLGAIPAGHAPVATMAATQTATAVFSATTPIVEGTMVTITTSMVQSMAATAAAPTSTDWSSLPLASQWKQCGGIGFTGNTHCVSPYTCVAISEWWSQCL